MKRVTFKSRENRGAAMVGLCLALIMFLILIGFFVWDMNRMQMAQRQLTALCDAAALAGSSMLSSQDVSYEDSGEDGLYQAQMTATQYAANMFCAGVVLGQRLYDPTATTGVTGIPVNYSVANSTQLSSVSANHINLWIQQTDPSTSFTNYTQGNAKGRAYYIQAAFGYQPSLSALGVGATLIMYANSTAGTQIMNVVMVFDCSGSMDDNTSVSFVERLWDWNATTQSGNDKYNYHVLTSNGASNMLYDFTGLDYTNAPNGTSVNVLPPQNLTNLGYVYNGSYYVWGSSSTYFDQVNPPLAFDLSMRSYVATPTTSYPFVSTVPSGTTVSSGSFTGPWYDNDFGTPPGDCEWKYGTKQTLSSAKPLPWGVSGVTGWDGVVNHGWGPGAPASFLGYYNAVTSDGNRYYYDPNAMPKPYSGASYAPFTDLVVNLVNLSFPLTQPQPASGAASLATSWSYSASGGFTYTFPSTTFTVFFAEGSGVAANYYYESDTQLQGQAFKFSNIAYLVEASRGNLDLDQSSNATNYAMALLNFGNMNGITQPASSDCKVGYQKAYQRLAMYVSQPFATAQAGAFKFFQNAAQTSAAYFGFVGFSASPANYTGNPDYCGYLSNSGFPTSLYYSCTGTPGQSAPSLACFAYHGAIGGVGNSPPTINPNAWMWSPMCTTDTGGIGPAGPAGSPTGIPYSSTLNANGPGNPGGTAANTWMVLRFGSNTSKTPGYQSNTSSLNWAYCNLGWQIPRCFLTGASTDAPTSTVQQSTFNGVCSNQTMSIYTNSGATLQDDDTNNANAGCNGLFHCRPLTDTGSLEALETGLANLGVTVPANGSTGTTAFSFSSLTGYGGTMSNGRAGAVNVLVMFTDGVPTDALTGTGGTASYTNYTNEVVNPAQQNGVPIYSIGLALNSAVQADQYQFLTTLTNNGANGSQFFQVTNAANLTAAFTGIAKQLTQCMR